MEEHKGQDYEAQFMAYCTLAANKKLNGMEDWNTVTIFDFLDFAGNDVVKFPKEEVDRVAQEIFKQGFDSFLETRKEEQKRAQAEWPVGRNY